MTDGNNINKKNCMFPHSSSYMRWVHLSCFSFFPNLFQAFILLEQEIEDALPKFQELIHALKYVFTICIPSVRFIDISVASHDDQPTKEASAARKRLLEAFAQYDALAKRIKGLPCANGPWSSQSRIQSAIAMRASLFLQRNMFPLQASFIPNLS